MDETILRLFFPLGRPSCVRCGLRIHAALFLFVLQHYFDPLIKDIIRLLQGYRLSTALTYDLNGNCIEGNGIPVDYVHPLSLDEEELIRIAEKMIW